MSTPSISVKVHSVAALEDWPSETSSIYSILNLPLPSWCATGPYPFVSHQNLPLLSELSESPAAFYTDRGDIHQTLPEVFNHTLSTVSDIRSLIAHYGPLCSALPFVSGFVRLLAQIADAKFVRPRTTTPCCCEFDGDATVLACHSVERASNPICDTLEDGPDPSLSAVATSFEIASDFSDSSPSASSINLPLDAHVIPGRGKHLSAILPFLCVGDIDNIVDLMSSVACQRHVWGIPQPVVGFALSNSGTVAQLVLSWIDPTTVSLAKKLTTFSRTFKRIVHIVCPATQSPMGIFDLTNVVSALSIAQLVLNLSNDFVTVAERAVVGCANNRLDWRSDSIPSENLSYGRDWIMRWLTDVQRCSAQSLSLPPTPPPSPPKSLHVMAPSRKALQNAKSQTLADAQMLVGSVEKPPKSYKSSSTFAATPTDEGLGDVKGQILTWLFERRSQTIGRIPFPISDSSETDLEKKEINAKLKSYGQMCDFRRATWHQNQLPAVDSSLLTIRDILIADLNRDPNGDKLASDHQRICSERLSALLSATASASLLDSKRHDVSVYEAESRHAWDSMLYHFYVANNEVISPYVLLEHTIHFARNISADHSESETFALDHRAQMVRIFKLASEVVTVTASLKSEPLVRRQAFAASQQAFEFVGILEQTPDDDLKRLVEQHSVDEPREGKTDAILFTSLPKPAELPTNTGIIRYIDPSKQSFSHSTAPRDIKTVTSSSTNDVVAQPSVTKADFKYFLQNPFSVSTPNSAVHRAVPPSPSFNDRLLLPHATVEYKKVGDSEGKALNQGRMYLVSVISFYASALGIGDFPFYCLVTSGTRGAVLMGWHSSEQQQIYILERNAQTYDIALPLQAFHFATFLLRLRDDQKELTKRVEDALKVVNLKEFDRWTKSTQVDHAKQVRGG